MVDDNRFGYAVCIVFVAPDEVVAVLDLIGEDRCLPIDLAADRFGVGIDQQFRFVESVALFRFPRAIYAIAIALTGFDVAEETVPDEGSVRSRKSMQVRLVAFLIEETHLHAGSHVRSRERSLCLCCCSLPQEDRVCLEVRCSSCASPKIWIAVFQRRCNFGKDGRAGKGNSFLWEEIPIRRCDAACWESPGRSSRVQPACRRCARAQDAPPGCSSSRLKGR